MSEHLSQDTVASDESSEQFPYAVGDFFAQNSIFAGTWEVQVGYQENVLLQEGGWALEQAS